jgi:hypothetical protein
MSNNNRNTGTGIPFDPRVCQPTQEQLAEIASRNGATGRGSTVTGQTQPIGAFDARETMRRGVVGEQ